MQVATYNIASGGFTGYESRARKPERLKRLKNAIGTINADILGLTDTFRWKEIFTAEDLKNMFGYPYSFHIDMDDTRVDKRIGVALLSRFPMASSEAVRLNNHNAIRAAIKVRKGKRLDVFVIYLDDLSEAVRQKQVEALLRCMAPSRPAIIMGDFNALWPKHVPVVRRRVGQFLQANPAFSKRPDYHLIKAAFDSLYEATALLALQKHGLTEPQGQLRPTALTTLHPFAMPTIFPVDHILAKACSASAYSVHDDPAFAMAADHFPLSATLAV
jgi:endonuclease/exonuclease/phosphatase family metal-dependent hydrolase